MITQSGLKQILHYDPDTGKFSWKVSDRWRKAGAEAGFMNRGYRQIGIGRKTYMAHRLAWLYMTGEWPENGIDHKDRNRANNRWINLRVADYSQNGGNQGMSVNNTSGFKGVHWNKEKKRWIARIRHKGEAHYLGEFDSPNAAALAYDRMSVELFNEFAVTNSELERANV